MPPAPHPNSYYAASANPSPERPPLGDCRSADVCIVGAGFTGLSAAITLAEAGMDVCVLEAECVGWGASGRNGGELLPGVACGVDGARRLAGPDAARFVWEMSLAGVRLVRDRVIRYDIACDLTPGYVEAAAKPRHVRNLEDYASMMERDYGYEGFTLLSRGETARRIGSDRFHGGMSCRDAWHLHPLNLALGYATAAEAAGATILEQSRVTAIEKARAGYIVRTREGEVRADHVLLAGNAYQGNLVSEARAKIMPCANFIVATEPLPAERFNGILPSNDCVADTNFVLDYFRLSADRRLLFGGLVSYSTVPPAGLSERMRRRIAKTFPDLAGVRIDYLWAGLLAITVNRLPAIGRTREGIYYAQGFSGHGLSLASISGDAVARAILGTAERFDVFDKLPKLDFPGGRLLRLPLLLAVSTYQKLRDLL